VKQRFLLTAAISFRIFNTGSVIANYRHLAVTFLAAVQPTVAFMDIRENGLFFISSLPLAGFKKLSPLASTFLLLRQKKGTKEKATPGSLERP
jgi:hypothetical protein